MFSQSCSKYWKPVADASHSLPATFVQPVTALPPLMTTVAPGADSYTIWVVGCPESAEVRVSEDARKYVPFSTSTAMMLGTFCPPLIVLTRLWAFASVATGPSVWALFGEERVPLHASLPSVAT